jgi:hypothetical protein
MKKYHIFSLFLALGFFLLLVSPHGVIHAQDDASSKLPKTVDEVITVIDKIQQYVARIFWIIAMITAFYAAFLFATASGDPKRYEQAKNQIKYTIIAIVIGLMVYGLPTLIKDLIST